MTITTKFPRAKPPRLNSLDVKALVRFRDGYRCTQCGITAREHVRKHKTTLDVHRLVPGSRYTVKGCVALCRKCHGPQPRSKHGRSGKHVVAIPIELYEAMERYGASQTIPVPPKIALRYVLRKFLESVGYWPWPRKPDDD